MGYFLVLVPREGIEPPTPASSEAYFGLYHLPWWCQGGQALPMVFS